MNHYLNLANKDTCIALLEEIRDNDYVPFYLRITNSHIKDLNAVIGRNVFRKDAVYVNSQSLWEIMQPVGGEGGHHYHGLTPEQVYNALSRMRYSKEIRLSHDGRYIVTTDISHSTNVFLVVILDPDGYLKTEMIEKIIVVVSIYPKDKKPYF